MGSVSREFASLPFLTSNVLSMGLTSVLQIEVGFSKCRGGLFVCLFFYLNFSPQKKKKIINVHGKISSKWTTKKV